MVEFKKVGVYFLLLSSVGIVTYLLSNFLGLAGTGFESEEILKLQTFYYTGAIFAFFLTSLWIYNVVIKKGDEKYGNSIGFADLGANPHLSFFKRFTIPQITLLTFIIFLFLATINITFFTAQKTYTSLGFLETQQFTQGQSILYSSLLVPGSENLGAALVFAIIITVLYIFAKKYNMPSSTFFILLLVLSFFGLGLYGLGNHVLRYSGQEISLLTVFFFWAITGLLLGLTGLFTIPWNMHIVNNLVFDLSRFWSLDTLRISLFVSVIILTSIYVFFYRGRLVGTRQVKELEV